MEVSVVSASHQHLLDLMAYRLAQRVESELHAKLAEKDPLFRDIDHLIAQ